MNVSKAAIAAVKANDAESIAPDFVQWEKKGQQIAGAYVAKSLVDSGNREGKPYNQYLFDTDSGRVKFHLGSVGDSEIGAQFLEGEVYVVEYQGKEEIGRSRSVNRFNCYHVSADVLASVEEKSTGGESA